MSIFDLSFYLSQNPDVAAAVAQGETTARGHLDLFGWRESRDPSANFDVSYYLTEHQDVADAGINPLDHYETFGEDEGRQPNPSFDPSFYRSANPDVAQSGLGMLEHYIESGAAEGRLPSQSIASTLANGFEETEYLEANADVAAAVERGDFDSGLEHWLAFGFNEGRSFEARSNEALVPDTEEETDTGTGGGGTSSGGTGTTPTTGDTTPPTATVTTQVTRDQTGEVDSVLFTLVFDEEVTNNIDLVYAAGSTLPGITVAFGENGSPLPIDANTIDDTSNSLTFRVSATNGNNIPSQLDVYSISLNDVEFTDSAENLVESPLEGDVTETALLAVAYVNIAEDEFYLPSTGDSFIVEIRDGEGQVEGNGVGTIGVGDIVYFGEFPTELFAASSNSNIDRRSFDLGMDSFTVESIEQSLDNTGREVILDGAGFSVAIGTDNGLASIEIIQPANNTELFSAEDSENDDSEDFLDGTVFDDITDDNGNPFPPTIVNDGTGNASDAFLEVQFFDFVEA